MNREQNSIQYKGIERRLHVCSFCTHPSGYYHALVQSASKLNIELVILGWGIKWEGFGQKLAFIYEHICSLPPGDAVMSIDGFDVILLQPSPVILERFAHHGGFEGRFLACAEGANGIWMTLHNLLFRKNDTMSKAWPAVPPYAPKDLQLQLLNAGCWISTVEAAKKIFGNIPKEINDQKYLTTLYIDRKMKIEVDAGCTIFHLWRSRKDVELTDVETAQEQYAYKRPFYDEREGAAVKRLQKEEKHKKQKSGEFVETALSEAANRKIVVDLKTKSVPCLLHIHCMRNVDDITRQMGLPSSMNNGKSAIWYCWYSFKAHLVSPVTWWWAIIAMGVLLFLGCVGIVTGGIGTMIDSVHAKIFSTILSVSCMISIFALVLLAVSILYIDRPRRPPRRCSIALPGGALWWIIALSCLLLWFVSTGAIYIVIWNCFDAGHVAKKVLSFTSAIAVVGTTILLILQVYDKCDKPPEETSADDALTPLSLSSPLNSESSAAK